MPSTGSPMLVYSGTCSSMPPLGMPGVLKFSTTLLAATSAMLENGNSMPYSLATNSAPTTQ